MTIDPWDVLLVPAGERWRPATSAERRSRLCRWSTKTRCSNPVAWMLDRGSWRNGKQYASWWGYCEHHLYGRVVLDGELYLAVKVIDSGWRRELP